MDNEIFAKLDAITSVEDVDEFEAIISEKYKITDIDLFYKIYSDFDILKTLIEVKCNIKPAIDNIKKNLKLVSG
jgi:hypothetical protein